MDREGSGTRLAPEQACEETALVRFRFSDLRGGVFATAPLSGGNSPLHFLNVLAAAGPRCFATGSAFRRATHPAFSLSSGNTLRRTKNIPLGVCRCQV